MMTIKKKNVRIDHKITVKSKKNKPAKSVNREQGTGSRGQRKLDFSSKKSAASGNQSAVNSQQSAVSSRKSEASRRKLAVGNKQSPASGNQSTVNSRMQQQPIDNALLATRNLHLEKQIAVLEEKIALLQEEGQVQSSKFKVQSNVANQNHFEQHYCAGGNSSLNSALPKIGPPLAIPVIDNVTPIGAHSMRVSWSPVTNAGGYLVRYSTDETFATNVNSVSVDEQTAAVTLTGLASNTMYYVSIKTLGNGTSIDTAFSAATSATTGISTNDEIVTHLQSWFSDLQSEFQNMSALVPQLDSDMLNTLDRRRLNGSGVRRYGYIEKVFEVSQDFPQFWPAFVDDGEELSQLVKEIDVLRNLLIWFRFCARVIQDMLLLAGNDAFRIANTYYTTARDAARRGVPEAGQVFQMLQLFWRRRRNMSAEPTEHEVERDVRALLRGTKDGNISVSNESDQVVKGKKVIIDNTQRKPRGGVKIVERGEVRD